MFIRKKKTPNQNIVIQIVENFRDKNTTIQRVLRHVGTAKNEEELKNLLALAQTVKIQMEHKALAKEKKINQGSYASSLGDWKEIKDSQLVNISQLEELSKTTLGIHDIYGFIYDSVGFTNLFTRPRHRTFSAKILKEIVLGRIANPTSKKATTEFLLAQFRREIKLDHVYQMMDKIDDLFVERIQRSALATTLSLTQEKLQVLFYDATTLYFESFTEDTLKQNGYSKDMKFNQAQVLLALFITEKGLPIGYELFPGATFEGHTLIPILDKLKKRYQLEDVVFVADRGLFNETNLKYLEENSFKYIVGARIKNVNAKIKNKILNPENYKALNTDTGQRVAQFEYIQERQLVVSYSAERAYKDQNDREKAIVKLQQKLAKSKNPKSLLNNYGYKKYIVISGDAKIKINQNKLESDSQWDGLHGVITNLKNVNPEQILAYYRGLWQIESCFRVKKHDLKIRPIYHWTERRIKAHVAINFMAFVCIKYLEYRLSVQSQKVSPEKIRTALMQVQATTIHDKQSDKSFILSSPVNPIAKEIYRVIGIKIPKFPVII